MAVPVFSLAVNGCAARRAARNDTSPSALPRVEVTWDTSRVVACTLLGYARAGDGVGIATARFADWDDEIARRTAAHLGGDTVLRVATPQSLHRFPAGPELAGTDAATLLSDPDPNAVIGIAYRCRPSP